MLTHDHRVHGSFLFIFACPEVPLSCILQVEVFEDVSKDLLEGGLLLFFLKILGLLEDSAAPGTTTADVGKPEGGMVKEPVK